MANKLFKKQIKYFDKMIQSKLESLPRHIEGNSSKDVLTKKVLEIQHLREARAFFDEYDTSRRFTEKQMLEEYSRGYNDCQKTKCC